MRRIVTAKHNMIPTFMIVFALPVLVLLICGCPHTPPAGDYILIYNGPSADADGVDALTDAFEDLGYDVEYIARLSSLPAMLENAQAFVIGGTGYNTGRIIDALWNVKGELKTYIQNGGRFLGICGGAYIASKGSQWDDGYEEGISLVNAESFEYDPDYEDPQIITVTWLGAARSIYLQGGPAFDAAALPGAQILARYEDNTVAAFISASGNGKIALCGPHPEADASWLIDNPPPLNANQWTDTRDLFNAMVDDLMDGAAR